VALTAEVITLLTTLMLAFIAWSAGPRIGAQIIAQIGGVAGALMSRFGKANRAPSDPLPPMPPGHNQGDQG
jgi:succinate-acetate transporter protein